MNLYKSDNRGTALEIQAKPLVTVVGASSEVGILFYFGWLFSILVSSSCCSWCDRIRLINRSLLTEAYSVKIHHEIPKRDRDPARDI